VLCETFLRRGSDGLTLGRRFNAGGGCERNQSVAAATVDGGEQHPVEYSGEFISISIVAAATGNHSLTQPVLKRRPKVKPSLPRRRINARNSGKSRIPVRFAKNQRSHVINS